MSSLILFICLVPLLTIALLGLNLLLASNKPDPEKVSAYECGFEPFADARSPFSINFYLVAILYLVFDLEILLLYPLIMSLHTVSLFGFWVAILFCIILALGFVYEFSKGALEYATHQTSSESTNSHQNSPPSTRSILIFFTPRGGVLIAAPAPGLDRFAIAEGLQTCRPLRSVLLAKQKGRRRN